VIDLRILSETSGQILRPHHQRGECANLIWRRRNTHWYGEFQNIYESLFLRITVYPRSPQRGSADGITAPMAFAISNHLVRLDQIYREIHFTCAPRVSRYWISWPSGSMPVCEQTTCSQSTTISAIVRRSRRLVRGPIVSQSEFLSATSGNILARKTKVAVIISDGLRYEIGQEFIEKIEQEEGYSAESNPCCRRFPVIPNLAWQRFCLQRRRH